MKRRVLITGVAGFIGSNLAQRLLEEGHRVVGIDDLSYGVREQVPGAVEFHKADIRSRDIYPLFENADTVFHLAAKNCIADCQKDPAGTSDINVTGTINVLEACRLKRVRKVVCAESSAIYEGSAIFPTPETEEKPLSLYACSKLSASSFAKRYAAAYGMKMTGLRYFNVYGPRQDYRRSIPPVISAFIIAILKGRRPLIYGTGEKRRDFIYVDDINEFHLKAMDDDRTNGGIYNLGSGKNYSMSEIFSALKRMLNCVIEPEYAGDLPCEAAVTLADISRAEALGWSPKVDLARGLCLSVEYIKKNVMGKI